VSPHLEKGWETLRRTVASWAADYAQSMGAALAFYTLFSIAPLLLIVIAVAGYFFGADAARGGISAELSGLVGADGARAIQQLIASANEPFRRSVAAGIGIVVFLVGATSVFNELQDSLNRIWRAPRTSGSSGLLGIVRARLLSIGLILAIAFLLIVSLVISTAITQMARWWGPTQGARHVLAQVANFGITFALITVMFALIYKVVPRRSMPWRDVWRGAGVTSLLFAAGKLLIGIYLGHSGVVTAFGGLGSLAVFLLWVYYSAQIFLLGAEYTWVISNPQEEVKLKTAEAAAASEPRPAATG
jgi:membrane protein